MKYSTTTRIITHNGQPLPYELHRKKVKNINLRIHTDCKVAVSAPPSVPLAYVDRFVMSKADYILSAQAHYRDIQRLSPATRDYIDGEIFHLLGQPFILLLLQGDQKSVEIQGNYLRLTTQDIHNTKQIKAQIDNFSTEQCQMVFLELSNQIAPLFQSYGIAMPEIRMRMMKSRWGSCMPTKSIITLNKKLIETPTTCIEYVVLHEYCHLIHPNHSKDFYNLVAHFMPDWAVRRQALKQWA